MNLTTAIMIRKAEIVASVASAIMVCFMSGSISSLDYGTWLLLWNKKYLERGQMGENPGGVGATASGRFEKELARRDFPREPYMIRLETKTKERNVAWNDLLLTLGEGIPDWDILRRPLNLRPVVQNERRDWNERGDRSKIKCDANWFLFFCFAYVNFVPRSILLLISENSTRSAYLCIESRCIRVCYSMVSCGINLLCYLT